MLTKNDSELLSAYADKELTGKELALVQKNLTIHMEWREELENIQKTKMLATALPRIQAPVDLLNLIEQTAQENYEKAHRFSLKNLFTLPTQFESWAWRTSMAFAAASALAIGIHHMHENSFIPLEPLLAAHSRSSTRSFVQRDVVSASHYSLQLKQHAKN